MRPRVAVEPVPISRRSSGWSGRGEPGRPVRAVFRRPIGTIRTAAARTNAARADARGEQPSHWSGQAHARPTSPAHRVARRMLRDLRSARLRPAAAGPPPQGGAAGRRRLRREPPRALHRLPSPAAALLPRLRTVDEETAQGLQALLDAAPAAGALRRESPLHARADRGQDLVADRPRPLGDLFGGDDLVAVAPDERRHLSYLHVRHFAHV